jgi:hypothetical protein
MRLWSNTLKLLIRRIAARGRPTMKTSPAYDRPYIEYDQHRLLAGRMRSEMMNSLISKGATTVAPSRRALRNFGLAFLVATGAFWTVMLKDPPKTVAADPSTLTKAFSPLDLMVSVDLPTGDYSTH